MPARCVQVAQKRARRTEVDADGDVRLRRHSTRRSALAAEVGRGARRGGAAGQVAADQNQDEKLPAQQAPSKLPPPSHAAPQRCSPSSVCAQRNGCAGCSWVSTVRAWLQSCCADCACAEPCTRTAGGTIISRSDVLRGASWDVASADEGARSTRGGQVSNSYRRRRETADARCAAGACASAHCLVHVCADGSCRRRVDYLRAVGRAAP